MLEFPFSFTSVTVSRGSQIKDRAVNDAMKVCIYDTFKFILEKLLRQKN